MISLSGYRAPTQNKLKWAIANRKIAIGIIVESASDIVVEVLGRAGFDFVILDTEHAPSDELTTENMIRAAEVSGTTPLVRVPDVDPKRIMKALDSGACGIVVPHLKTREEAEIVVNATRYREKNFPNGTRGATPGVRAAKYHEWDGYWQAANRNTLVVGIVEDKEGVENIEEIASVESLDAISLGPIDLAVSLGHHGDTANQEVSRQNHRVISACKKYSKPVVGLAWDFKSAKKLIDDNITTILWLDEDVSVLYNTCKNTVQSVKGLVRPNIRRSH